LSAKRTDNHYFFGDAAGRCRLAPGRLEVNAAGPRLVVASVREASALHAFAALPQPIDLGSIDLERARTLSGRLDVASFVNGSPSHPWKNVTAVGPENREDGPADREDGAVRTAVLRGRRLDVEEGRRVGVVGVLRVIDHAPCFVGPVFVPGWVEVRVEE